MTPGSSPLSYLDHLDARLQSAASRGQLAIARSAPASEDEIMRVEHRLSAPFPVSVRAFYARINGFAVAAPALRVTPLAELAVVATHVPFATFDDAHRVAFQIEHRNVADEWEIVVVDTGRVMTHTIASFCTNKIWAWLERRRAVWSE